MLNKRADKLELLRIAEAVALEKSIDKELIINSMETGIAKAAKSKFGQDNEIKVQIDRGNGDIEIFRRLIVVEKPENLNIEISLKDALNLSENNKDKKIGDEIHEKHIQNITDFAFKENNKVASVKEEIDFMHDIVTKDLQKEIEQRIEDARARKEDHVRQIVEKQKSLNKKEEVLSRRRIMELDELHKYEILGERERQAERRRHATKHASPNKVLPCNNTRINRTPCSSPNLRSTDVVTSNSNLHVKKKNENLIDSDNETKQTIKFSFFFFTCKFELEVTTSVDRKFGDEHGVLLILVLLHGNTLFGLACFVA
jgi:hypothetical protein